MFTALAAGGFFLLLFWVHRRNQKTGAESQRLQQTLAETQRQLEQAEQRTRQLVGLLNTLHEYRVSPTGRISWSDLADFTVQTASPMTGADRVVLLRWDPEGSEYKGVAARGVSPEQLATLRVRLGEGVLGKAAQAGKVLAVSESTRAVSSPQESFLTIPYLVFPLWVHSQVAGLLIFLRPSSDRFGPEQTRLAALMARQVELTMENLDLYENRQRVYAELVATLGLTLSVRDTSHGPHADQCRDLVRAMAREMNLPKMLTEQIEFGALLHDIGKLGISEALLSKTSALTDEEYAAVKKHPEIGYRILRDVDFLKGVASIVLYHHEWVNGQGYPEGLAGEEIPLGARMVAIADAWDAMVTDQTYHKAISKNNAVAELRQRAGSQFDPKLVDVFIRVVDRLDRN